MNGLAAGVLAGSTAALALLPLWCLRGSVYLVLTTLAAAAYFVLWSSSRRPGADQAPLFRPAGMLGFALLLRVVPFLSQPWLSDDVHRYLWEGTVQRAGHSPYAHAPNAPELRELRDANWEEVGHKDVPSIYPPGIQTLLRWIPGSLRSWKIAVLGADLTVLLLLWWFLRCRRASSALAAAYAFHPLVILEFAGSGHLDVFAMAGVLAAVFALSFGRPLLGALACAAAVLVKPPAAAALASPLARGHLVPALVCTALVGLAVLPFAGDGDRALEGLRHYGRHWEFNSLTHPNLRSLVQLTKDGLESLEDGPRWKRELLEFGWDLQPNRDARVLGAGLFFVFAALWARRLRRWPMEATLAVLLVFLATTPTVYPWYVAWLVPFLPFVRSRAVLLLTLTTMVSGWVKLHELAAGEWVEPTWLRVAHWLPPAFLGAWELWRWRGTKE